MCSNNASAMPKRAESSGWMATCEAAWLVAGSRPQPPVQECHTHHVLNAKAVWILATSQTTSKAGLFLSLWVATLSKWTTADGWKEASPLISGLFGVRVLHPAKSTNEQSASFRQTVSWDVEQLNTGWLFTHGSRWRPVLCYSVSTNQCFLNAMWRTFQKASTLLIPFYCALFSPLANLNHGNIWRSEGEGQGCHVFS